ncbi:MAG: NfeD family protein [Gammaproteobacteria bacterium]|nr:NfeD family protein [Gammaproteobacteria bacterium]
MEWLDGSNWVPAIWLTVAIVLVIAEVLGAAGFLVGAAVAALALAALTYFVTDLGLAAQIFTYAVVAVIATLVYFRFFRATQPSNRDTLPKRSQMMIGRRFTLGEKLAAGAELRVQLGDSMWVVTSTRDIDRGAEVEVVDCDAMRLQVATLD